MVSERSSVSDFLAGMRDCLPVSVSIFAYALVFGVLARQKGLAPLEVMTMSGLAFSGAAQFVVLDLWSAPLPLWPIVLATLIVSLRYLLICASCLPLFVHWPRGRAILGMFLVTDENWAVTMGRPRPSAAHMLGGGVLVYLVWTLSTTAGSVIGTAVNDPARWGLDFAFTATFLALLIGMRRGTRDLLPWAVAAVVAIVASHLLPGKWYILVGGIIGSLAGVVRRDD